MDNAEKQIIIYETFEEFVDSDFEENIKIKFIELYNENFKFLYNLIYNFYGQVVDAFSVRYHIFIINTVFKNNLIKLYPIIINNFFILKLYKFFPDDLFPNKYLIELYKNLETNLLFIRILSKFDIPIIEENFYTCVRQHQFQLRFFKFEDSEYNIHNKTQYIHRLKEYDDDERIRYFTDNPLLNFIINYNCVMSTFEISQIYPEMLIDYDELEESDGEALYSWIKCYDKYLKQLDSNKTFLDSLRFYTHTGDVVMHSLLRNNFVEEYSTIPKDEVIFRINNLNFNIYLSKEFTLKYCNEFNVLSAPIILYRGFSGNVAPTKNSIINMFKNQFVSFSSDIEIALSFGNIIFQLELDMEDIQKFSFIPIHELKSYDDEYISKYNLEKEWLFPLDTTFKVIDDMKLVENPDDDQFYVLIKIKIHTQKYIKNISENSFLNGSVKNEVLNLSNFLSNL